MGKKVNPNSFRLVINRKWKSQWFTTDPKQEAKWLAEEDVLRKYLKKELKDARVSKIIIMRRGTRMISFSIHCVEVGLVRGQDDENIRRLENKIKEITGYKIVEIKVIKITMPALDAQLVSEAIAKRIEARENYKRAQKFAISNAMQNGARGIKTRVSGRLGGNDMSRTEGYLEGRVPAQTLKEQVEYGFSVAMTQYGLIGVKVWICIDPNNKLIYRNRRELRRRNA